MAQTQVLPTKPSLVTLPEGSALRAPSDLAKLKQNRLVALDMFRGLTIFLMLLVNNVSLDTETPPQLMHAEWNLGLHLADMVFPSFLFCVGVALPYSYASFQKTGKDQYLYILKALVRAGALFVIGCGLDSAINRQLSVSMGVLQLIGLAYFVAAIAYQASPWLRVSFAAVLLAAYGFAIQHISFSGAPAGTFEETSNLIGHLNKTYLTPHNLQGILSTIPTAGLVLYGSLIGDILREQNVGKGRKLLGIIVSGIGLVALGDIWSVFLPYNKPVWTPTYLLVAGGLAAFLVALIYVVVDLGRQKWIAYPFRVFGSNAILAYAAPILVKVLFLELWMVDTSTGNISLRKAILEWLKGNYGNVPGGWAYTGAYICFWWIVLWILYRQKWFLRV